jgi:hypothetical protein
LTSNFTVEGEVNIKELGGHAKLFFTNIKVMERRKPKPKKEPKEGEEEGGDEKPGTADSKRPGTADTADRPGTADTAGSHERSGTADTSSGKTLGRSETVEKMIHDMAVANGAISDQKEIMPDLQVYLTRRRPKAKMTEIDRNGTHVFLTSSRGGLFGVQGSTGNFSVSLKDIPDPLAYNGIVVVKRPADEPVTEGWVIFGMVKFVATGATKTNPLHACKLDEIHGMSYVIMSEHLHALKLTLTLTPTPTHPPAHLTNCTDTTRHVG